MQKVSVLKAMAAKGIKQCHLFLLYQSVVLSIIDYGLGLTTVAQTNLLKVDKVQSNTMTIILHEIHARPPTNANQTESGAYFRARENPHSPLREAVKDTKGCRLGRGKSWMDQAEDPILQVCQL